MRKIAITIFLILAWCLSIALIRAETTSMKKITFDASGLRDPFKSVLPQKKVEEPKRVILTPKLEVPVRQPEAAIQGIVWGGKFPQVIINDRVLRVGDVANVPEPMTIIDIKPQEVVVLFAGKVFSLYP